MRHLPTASAMLYKKEPETKTPKDLHVALSVSLSVISAWKSLTPIARRDFITWVEGAKKPETRTRRIGIACDKLLKGDRRPCCYAIVPINLYRTLGKNKKAKTTWSTLNPTERRDFVRWIENIKDKKKREQRIEETCLILASGDRHP